MSVIQAKITRHAKKQKDTAHNEERNRSIETNPELGQMLELADRHIKAVIITVFHLFRS